MKQPLSFFVRGLPVGQPRSRARAVRKGKQIFAHVYNPGDADDWKMIVRHEAEKAWRNGGGYPCQFTGPLCVNLTFYFPRPKSHYRTNGELKPNAPKWHTIKPDRDNCDKAILDALTNLCIWGDDCQVCDGSPRKLYANDHRSGCLVEIKEASAETLQTTKNDNQQTMKL